jgi:hypothetical protein
VSYDYTPTHPSSLGKGGFQRWVYDQLRQVSSNFLYQTQGWQDYPVAFETQTGGSAPDLAQVQDDGAGSTGVFAYLFDAATLEERFFTRPLPHGRVTNSGLRPHVQWSPTSTDTGTVRWGLEYSIASMDGTFGTTTTVYAEDAGDGTADKHQDKAFAEISGSGVMDGAVILGRFFRDAAHANDTYTADAALLSFGFHLRMGAHGSDEEYSTAT